MAGQRSGNKYTKASYQRGKALRLKRKLEMKAAKKARMSIKGPKREQTNRYGKIAEKQRRAA